MLLFPTKTKYKKSHKRYKILLKKEYSYKQPNFGFSGLKSLISFRLTALQIEAVRKIVSKTIKKRYKSKLKLCLYPDLPVTKKSSGIRMGKGKGNVEFWCFLIKKGRILFELNKKQVSSEIAYNCFLLASKKLPGKFLVVV